MTPYDILICSIPHRHGKLLALLEEIGLDFWNDEGEDGTGIRTMTFDYGAFAVRLAAAGVTAAQPAPDLRAAAQDAHDALRLYTAVRSQPDGIWDFRPLVEKLHLALEATA